MRVEGGLSGSKASSGLSYGGDRFFYITRMG